MLCLSNTRLSVAVFAVLLIGGLLLAHGASAAEPDNASESQALDYQPDQIQLPAHAQLTADCRRLLRMSKSDQPLNFGAELGLQHACFVLGYQSARLTTALALYTETGDEEWREWFVEEVQTLADYFSGPEDQEGLGIDVLLDSVASKDPVNLALALANFKSLAETACVALGGRDAKWFFMLGCNDWYIFEFLVRTEAEPEAQVPELSFPGKTPGFVSLDLGRDVDQMGDYSLEVQSVEDVSTFYDTYNAHFYTYFGLEMPEESQV